MALDIRVKCQPAALDIRVNCQSAALDIRVKCQSAALDIRVKCQSAALDITVKCQPAALDIRVKCQSTATDIRVYCQSTATDIRVNCQSTATDIRVKTQIPTRQAIVGQTNGPTEMATFHNLKTKSWRNPLLSLLFFAIFNARHLRRTVPASNLPTNEITQNTFATGERHNAHYSLHNTRMAQELVNIQNTTPPPPPLIFQ